MNQVHETNGLEGTKLPDPTSTVDWTTPGLYITRLRLVSDVGYPYWDVSYCHGMLDGEYVRVILPFSQLPKYKMKAAIVQYAKKEGVFIKGILENISTLQ